MENISLLTLSAKSYKDVVLNEEVIFLIDDIGNEFIEILGH